MSVAIVTVLAAATVPTIQSRMTAARGQALANELLSIQKGLNAFRTNVGNFPKNLDYLTAMGTDKICTGIPAVSFTAGAQLLWRGPYLSRIITANYSPDGTSTIQDRLTYLPGPPPQADVTITSVDAAVAAVVEDIIDGPGQVYTGGSFIWDSNTLQADFRFPAPLCP